LGARHVQITQELRAYAEEHALNEEVAAAEGMAHMSEQFKKLGAEVYHEPSAL
jgi:hypothetical protein